MNAKYIIILIILISLVNNGFSQVRISENANDSAKTENKSDFEYEKLALGVGLGSEYSLIGGHFLIYPQKNIGIMAGAGYIIADVGFNIGLKLRLTEQKHKSNIQYYTFGQYGYISWVDVTNNHNYKKIFYGYTAGIGMDIRFNKPDGNYLSLSLCYKFNTDEIKKEIENYTNNNNLSDGSIIAPTLGISIGYHLVQ